MKNLLYLFIIIFTTSCAQKKEDLESQINKIIAGKNATVGVSILGIDKPFVLNMNGEKHLPMQSVFKFHIALAVLNLVDEGKLDLIQKILVKKTDLLENTWSPIREKYPNGNVELTLAEIIKYTVAQSDNNGCDILLKLIGGTKTVQGFINSKGVKDFQIKFNEEEMHQDWKAQYENYSSTNSIVKLLKDFHGGKIVSKSSTDFLMKIMIGTSTGTNKLIAFLPENIIIAHKTGSSGKNNAGITGAENDMGIVTLPNGNHYAICVFVSNSKETEEVNCKMIADISKLTFDHFN
ncbi:class A beta-lactamase, subclass A2 [Halpernia frigidisoli]|uniref:beta-lactamase n=1 Tax=Halpernia frigidisoli TaxID=1125876 RepID=A0A1I3D866_9FLAO|nr:class A beta-lactamase, subclass A2 [Halpernia frigidisoli]SFH82768.1 beta-lactamase class A [Halpernia frigidisoli]